MNPRRFRLYREPLADAEERGWRWTRGFVTGFCLATSVVFCTFIVYDCGTARADHFADSNEMVQPSERMEEDGSSSCWIMPEVRRSDLLGISVVGNCSSSSDLHLPMQSTDSNGSDGHNLHRHQDEMTGLASWYGNPYHGRRAGEQRAVNQGEVNGIQRDSTGLHLSVSNSSSLHPNSRPYGNTGEHPVGDVPVQYGYASWYGKPYHGRNTACGGIYDENGMTAAHRSLACGARVRVCRTDTAECVVVTITDRGPFVPGRVVDLSRAAMARIGGIEQGVVPVEMEVLP